MNHSEAFQSQGYYTDKFYSSSLSVQNFCLTFLFTFVHGTADLSWYVEKVNAFVDFIQLRDCG